MKTFEEKIISTLSGASQKNAIDFAEFLKANEITVDENHDFVQSSI